MKEFYNYLICIMYCLFWAWKQNFRTCIPEKSSKVCHWFQQKQCSILHFLSSLLFSFSCFCQKIL